MLTKIEMLQVVASLFKEQSYHGTALTEIGRALDLSDTTVNALLGTKQDMLWEVTSRVANLLLTHVRSIPRTIPAIGQFRMLIYRHMEVVTNEHNYVVVFNRDWMFLDAERRKEIQAQRTSYEGYLCRIIDEGVQQGSLYAPDEYAACSFILNSLQWSVPWDLSVDTAAFALQTQRYCLFLQRALCYEPKKIVV